MILLHFAVILKKWGELSRKKRQGKKLTTEVIEPAEVEIAKTSKPENKGSRGFLSYVFREAKNPKKLIEKDLCNLRLLFFLPQSSWDQERSGFGLS
jgi:hypothetical protein